MTGSLSESWDAPETFKAPVLQAVHTPGFLLPTAQRVRKVSHPPAQVPPSLHPSSSDEAGPLMGWSQVTSIHPSKSRNPLHCVASMTVNKGCCHFPEGRTGESAWPSIKPSCSRNCRLTSKPVFSVLGRAGLYFPASFQSLVRPCNWVPANRS